MVEDMSALTLAIVGETLFGADLTKDAADMNHALTEVLTGSGARLMMGGGLLRLPTPARRRSVESSATLDAIVQRMIDDHRRTGDTGDMLSMLISSQDDGESMSDEQVRDEAMTLVLAGHETTAMAMSWTWMLLARNPQVAEWLHEELDTVLGGRAPTFEDLGSLPRTHAVIAESMRMYPPAWSMGRRVLEDLTLGEWLVPRGAMVLSSQYALQRSPRWWDSPLAFQPQRWIGSDGAFGETNPGQPRGAWFPFGWGNRRCIGEQFAWTEAQLILATLAQRWEPQLQPGHQVVPQPAVTLRPKGGLPVTLRKRSR
jgi:cytochrome P450